MEKVKQNCLECKELKLVNKYFWTCDDCVEKLKKEKIIADKAKGIDWVGYFCGAVTDIIFNREAGWSDKLEKKVEKMLEEYKKDIIKK